MNFLKTFWCRLHSLLRRREVKREIDEEPGFHIEQRTAENVAGGMSPENAEREARKRLGSLQSVCEECRWFKGASLGEGVWKDIRLAVRQLAKSPVFTAVAVSSLALGIGANTAIFSGLNAVLLRSMPVRNPQELRLINWAGRNLQLNHYTGMGIGVSDAPSGGLQMGTSFPYPAYRDFRDHGQGFADVFAFFSLKSVTAVARGEASVTSAMLVSGNYFSGYGASTLIGRPIQPDDDQPGAASVAVITYRWWERRCGLDPNVIGEVINLNRVSYTVVGVLPPDYTGPVMGDPSDIYVPMSAQQYLAPTRPLDSPNHWWIQIMGRLAPGANEAQAQASLSALFQRTLAISSTKMDQPGIVLEDGNRGQLMGRRKMAKPFLALTLAVGLVLLIACTNLAALLLARGAARQHEMALRSALGAGRWRLIRQSLVESLLLSVAGGGLGLAVSAWIKRALLSFFSLLPDGFHFDLRTDNHVLLFTAGVSVLTALVFGFLPALHASKVDPLAGLKNQSSRNAPRLRLGKALVAAQVGLSVLVVFGAALMMRTFANLARVHLGFDSRNVLLFRLEPEFAGYTGKKLTEFYDRVGDALSAIPGAQAVAFSSFPLTSGTYASNGRLEFPGREKRPGGDFNTAVLGVSESYFRTMSIPLLAGRGFTVNDVPGSLLVAVVNQTFARKYFPGQNPLGQKFKFQDGSGRTFQIVGLCRDAKYNQVRAEVPPLAYYSQRQVPEGAGAVTFAIRSALPPYALLPAARKAIAALDPQVPLSRIKTQEQQVAESIAGDRLFASLGAALALLALLLSCIGLYSLMGYNVARRTREMGVRLALGATRRQVARPIVREALWLVGIGLTVGLPAALALARLIKSQLYGVAPTDPAALIGAGALLIGVALVSAWLPARRAAKINPIEALRNE